MSEPQGYLRWRLLHSFSQLVDRLDPEDLIAGCVQRRILPLSESERLGCMQRREGMMRLLGKVYRQSYVDRNTLSDFVSVLREKNAADSGHRYEEVIESLTKEQLDCIQCDCRPFSEIDKLVFNCTRPVVEKNLEPRSVLPALVSEGVITPDTCDDVLDNTTRLAQVHCLMQAIQERGSRAFEKFVHTLSESDDRSASGVGNMIQDCLVAHEESPYTCQEWRDHISHMPTTSDESEAFRRTFSDMFTFISDRDPHLDIVNHLYSSLILDKTTRDAVTDCRKQRVEQIRSLLQALEAQIESKPQVYREIIHSLEQGRKDYFHELAAVLQQKYDDQLERKTQEGGVILVSEIETDSVKTQQPSSAMTEYQERLRVFYMSAERDTSQQKWPGRVTNRTIPTNLAVIEKEKAYRSTANAFTQPTLHGNIDEIDKNKKPINKECLFDGPSRCIVVQGAAGIGKSMFGLELAQDWVKRTGTMKRFQLLNIVQLRFPTAHSVSSVCDLLHPKPSKEVEEEILSSGGEGMLLVFDGYDELPKAMQDRDSVYSRLILGTYLPKARILITSRPTAAKQLEKLITPGHALNIEILGFQLQNIEACIHGILHDEAQQRAFLQYIDSNLVIKNMMYIPLHTAIVVELFKLKSVAYIEQNSETVNYAMTLTELFTDLCRCLIYRDMHSRMPDDLPSFEQLQMNDLPESIRDNFRNLSSHAYHSLLQQELVFDSLPADFNHMGFMRSVTVQSCVPFAPPSQSCSFLHLTVQEFLAAFYLWYTQKPIKRLEMVEHIPKDHRNMVLRFLAGLSQFKEVGWLRGMESMGICLDLQGNQGCNSTLLNCLFEAQDRQACEEVFPSGYTINYSPMTATQFDCFALGYCIANSGQNCRWKLCAIGGEGLGAIAAGICSVQGDPRGRIDLIKLSYGGEEIHNLALFPDCILKDIRELNLSNCGLINDACSWLADFLPKVCFLRQLDLGDNPFSGGNASKLFAALSQLTDFQYLDLLHAQLDETDIRAIRNIVKKNGTLRNLIIGDRLMSPNHVELMVDVLLADSSLEGISFMNIDFPRLATRLADRLQSNTTLKSVMLWDRSFCTDGALKLLGALEGNKTLCSMTLMPWYKKNIPSHILSLPAVQSRIQWFIYPERKK